MPTVSASWNASVPIAEYATWPVITTIGIESRYASHERRDDVGRRGTARDHRDTGPAGRVRVARRHVPGALLVAHEDVADRRVDQRVVDGEDRPAREAEHDLHAFHLETLDEGLGSGQLHDFLFGWIRMTKAGMKNPSPAGEGRKSARARSGGRALHNYENEVEAEVAEARHRPHPNTTDVRHARFEPAIAGRAQPPPDVLHLGEVAPVAFGRDRRVEGHERGRVVGVVLAGVDRSVLRRPSPGSCRSCSRR